MSSADRAYERGTRRARRILTDLAAELREQRASLGLSQAAVAAAAQISRSRYTRIEGARIEHLTIADAARIASVVGLDLSARVYPGGGPLRDGAHAGRLHRLTVHVHPPLELRTEVLLPASPGRHEQRAWDAEIRGAGERTTIELEMRLRDGQAAERRIALKRRDDPSDHFLLLVADTRHNRRVLAGVPAPFADPPRLRPSVVHRALEQGRHPGSGILLV
jgi:transcriptional regulator with XRE-family HTH domain